ncbi:cytochrome P460 family protein [Acidobacterium sp. S8]|uniref:cytochrome P460 family protein n=1 Tax=Acidobacterium sp. S8 TaxID=1641854 RepID=UPI00131CE649|nr:cytochrome P460 family protein [Acidobacterium sp. S8]
MKKPIYVAALSLLALFSGCSHRTPAESDLFNTSAEIEASKLPFNPLHWKVIISGIDPQRQTMSTLYGNDLAVQSARAGHDVYPDGSVLSLVTWTQREDPHWFGARIPGKVKSVEFVTVGKDSSKSAYKRFEGPDLAPATLSDTEAASARRDSILGKRASVMP